MKWALVILIGIILILGSALFVKLDDNNIGIDSYVKRIKKAENQRDSIESLIKLTRDTLEMVYQEMTKAQIETRKAHYRTDILKREYEKILFVAYPNDSVRMRELSKLYHSIKYP